MYVLACSTSRNTGTPEHGTPEHQNTGTSRNIPEHPENLEHPLKPRNNPRKPRTPPKKPGTPPRKPGTPFFYWLPAVYPLLQELILSISRIKIYFLFPLKR